MKVRLNNYNTNESTDLGDMSLDRLGEFIDATVGIDVYDSGYYRVESVAIECFDDEPVLLLQYGKEL